MANLKKSTDPIKSRIHGWFVERTSSQTKPHHLQQGSYSASTRVSRPVDHDISQQNNQKGSSLCRQNLEKQEALQELLSGSPVDMSIYLSQGLDLEKLLSGRQIEASEVVDWGKPKGIEVW